MKAHDIFPAVCYPDLFWRTARENLDASWHLMDPHEIETVMGYALEDSWGEEFGVTGPAWKSRALQSARFPSRKSSA
mgnify:CR=1 FL=1